MVPENPERYSPLSNPIRVKRFMKHVLSAVNKREQKNIHTDLQMHISKIKESAPKRSILQLEIRRLEQKLNKVLNITAHEDQTANFLRGEIKHLQTDVSSLKEQDSQLIESLRDQIFILENDLKKSDFQRNEIESKNKLEIENISSSIVDLRERIKQSIESKEERDNRIKELEERIKAKVNENLEEILKLEKHLELMEEKYELAKKEAGNDTSVVQAIDEKIKLIKQKIMMRKAGITPKKEGLVKMSLPETQKNAIVPGIKHDLAISSVPELPLPKDTLPNLKPAPTPEIDEKLLKKPYEFNSLDKIKSLESLEEYKPHESFFDKLKKMLAKKPKSIKSQ